MASNATACLYLAASARIRRRILPGRVRPLHRGGAVMPKSSRVPGSTLSGPASAGGVVEPTNSATLARTALVATRKRSVEWATAFFHETRQGRPSTR